MSDSSATTGSGAFNQLTWRQVVALLSVICNCRLKEEKYLERRFRENASGYSQAVGFLTDVGVLGRVGGEIHLLASLPQSEVDLGPFVLNALATSENRFRAEVLEFLGHFQLSNGVFRYRADPIARASESGARNFLIEAGAIMFDGDTESYFAAPVSYLLLGLAKSQTRRITPKLLQANQRSKDEIGLRAEVFALEYERARLDVQYHGSIEHVALHNAAAGFDILSVTADDGCPMPLCIEVKAVSLTLGQFFWTANEVAVAKLMGKCYFLYLVPIGGGGRIESDPVVIEDPNTNVLEDDEWSIEPNVCVCRRRSSGMKAIGGMNG